MNRAGGPNNLDLLLATAGSGLMITALCFFFMVWAIFRREAYRSLAVLCASTLAFTLASGFTGMSYLSTGSLSAAFEVFRVKELVAAGFLVVLPYLLASAIGGPAGLGRFNRGLAWAGLGLLLFLSLMAYLLPSSFLHKPFIDARGNVDARMGVLFIAAQALLALVVLYTLAVFAMDFLKWGTFRKSWSVYLGIFLCGYLNVSAICKGLLGFYIDPLAAIPFSRTVSGQLALSAFLSYGFFRIFLIQAREESRSRAALEQGRMKMQAMLYSDDLTGLPNRRRFIADLDSSIAEGKEAGIILMDLDNFMEFNECFGDDSGDSILKSVGGSLSTLLPPGVALYRMGGDEFSILLPEGSPMKELAALAERIRERSSGGFRAGSKLHPFGMAMALVSVPPEGAAPESALSNAYAALNEAKKSRNSICAYSDSLKRDSLARISTVQSMREGMREGFFSMVYQPIHDRQGRVCAAEALLRWDTGQGGVPMSPAYFIPLLESSGLMPEMGELIIRLVLKDLGERLAGASAFPLISINLSAHQLKAEGLGPYLVETLAAAGAPMERVQFEVTESAFLDREGVSVANLSYLRSRGSPIAVDDFGTGYSNLGYLRNLPIDKIKVDQSFMRSVPGDPAAEGLLVALSDIGRSFGLRLVAEGVETEAQRIFLHGQGYDEYQGFLFSRGLRRDDFLRYLGDS